MLRFLFPGLTADPKRGERLFAAASAEARRAHWYTQGGQPDTLDGRFRMLATILALVIVRLEQVEGAGNPLSVALTERFAEVMESEHRELGLGDPKLGRTVRRLVSALGRRVDVWREAVAGESGWSEAARSSLHGSAEGSTGEDGLAHNERALHDFWSKLAALDAVSLSEGKMQ